jgi:hypothetical protein
MEATENPHSESTTQDDQFPEGTDETDRVCWVCEGKTVYRHCKIICANCGFTRDCSDP